MQSAFQIEKIHRAVRRLLLFFIIVLFLSGFTAIPVISEMAVAKRFFDFDSPVGIWLNHVYDGLVESKEKYPWLFYGFDWLAFAHFMLAIAFIGPYRDPVRNKWVVEFGVIACLLIVPFAFVAGYFRGIPIWWRVIDCSFGIIGMIPLAVCYRKIIQLEEQEKEEKIWYESAI